MGYTSCRVQHAAGQPRAPPPAGPMHLRAPYRHEFTAGATGRPLGTELENRIPLGHHRRACCRAQVLLDPIRCAPGGLVRASLVFTHRHGHAAVATANGRVIDEAWNPADE